ncbi:MAG: ATP-grasp domain-containing protein [Proteobacteria bacterium]|nr:ATP-grasp domain-containing protein [Pseudomonadota bacterium]
MKKVLIANRGEIAIRIMRAAGELNLATVAVYSTDDQTSMHVRCADEAVQLEGRGAGAYLSIEQIIGAARSAGCDAIHPGYGFLSERADLAQACEDNGLIFIGPTPSMLAQLGNKSAARDLAVECDVPVLEGTHGATSLKQAEAFYASLGRDARVIIKAVYGGGGRGMRVVNKAPDLAQAYERAQSEALSGFGHAEVYVERYLPSARHIEIQIIGDGNGQVIHAGERECSLQRRHQKLIEIAPSPTLTRQLRSAMTSAAVRLGERINFRSLGTIEFLLDAASDQFFFMEANARLQVEHTVTEEVTGVDLVKLQLRLAAGAALPFDQAGVPTPRGYAIQARVNMETMDKQGNVRPAGGTLSVFEAPAGPGIRTDTYAYAGYTTNPGFDSLLAKIICSSPSPDYADAVTRTRRALQETRIEGVATNLTLLSALVGHPAFVTNEIDTNFVESHLADLLQTPTDGPAGATRSLAGASINRVDPLAVLDHGRSTSVLAAPTNSTLTLVKEKLPAHLTSINAPMQGTIVSFNVNPGDKVFPGKPVLVMEAMKMEHVVESKASGYVERLGVEAGDTVFEDHPLIYVEIADVEVDEIAADAALDLDYIRPDLQEVFDRHAAGLDENRPNAVAKRRKTGHRTARENVDDLCDEGTFVEYGASVLAAQRRRRSIEDLIENTTGDGMVCGLGQVNGSLFAEDRARTMIMSYDYMVLAGTQGMKNHAKKDRLFEIAREYQLPTVLFAEGGGGRPGDTDGSGVAGLDCWAFTYFARLSGLVPIVGITTGRCFAGNAVLLACCDVIIATEGSNIGIGGPAMIEGGGLGIFKPEEVGPMDVQVPNGVVDIAVKDEQEAVAVTKKYLSYFQGSVNEWEVHDPRELRFVVPENRLRYYDMREVINKMADVDSVLEIRRHWGPGIITSFIRVEGRPIGVVANNPGHLSGAIDSDGADKGTRFLQLCDAFDIPLLFLCDCPGIMVGPEIEKTALVSHAGRMFVTGANVTVPFFTIITRKAYGLGAQAMAGGSFKAPIFTVSWPTGEFGGMGLEGAVKLGYRKELQAITDPEERKETYEKMVAGMYERGKAVNTASHFEIDDVIDPAESRTWISRALASVPARSRRAGKKRPNVDTW